MTSHLVVTSGWAHAPCLPPVILDGRNLYKDPRPMEEPGFGYRCVGPTVQKVRALDHGVVPDAPALRYDNGWRR